MSEQIRRFSASGGRSKMKIYIAGPITGKLEYKREFKQRERILKTKGHIVLNPAFLPDGLKDYMPTCKAMIDQSDAVYFMTGWRDSVGATEEHVYATKKNKKIIFEGDM
jgi:nucleoside 2-deoxyribosyltransferase